MDFLKITTIFVMIIFMLKHTASLPLLPNQNVFRLFYEKPSLNFVQEKLIAVTNPKPVVDTAKESEKCCNTQQHLPGKKLLRVYEGISSALATAAEVPKQAKDVVGAAATKALNNIGAKIVGLQK